MSEVFVHDASIDRVRTTVAVVRGVAGLTFVDVKVTVDGRVVDQTLVRCLGIQPSAADLAKGGERLVEMLSELVASHYPLLGVRRT